MTALPGAGWLPGMDGVPPEEEEPEPDEPLEPVEPLEPPVPAGCSLSCCANGSLLAKRLNEASWPSCTAGGETSDPAPPGVGVLGGPCAPWRVGAASDGVPAGGVDVVVVALETGVGGG